MYFKNGKAQSRREEEVIMAMRQKHGVHPAAIRKYREEHCVGCSHTRKNCVCDCDNVILSVSEQAKELAQKLNRREM